LGLTGKFFCVEIDSYVTGFGFEGGECEVNGSLAGCKTFFGGWGEDLTRRWGGLCVRSLMGRDRGSEDLKVLFLEVEIVADVEYSADDGDADHEGNE